MYVKVVELPASIQSVLSSVGYGRKDIEVRAAETFSTFCGGQSGQRSWIRLVNITSGETLSFTGSWGGANMFQSSQSNPVDSDQTERPLATGFAFIYGSSGGRGTFASIEVHPDTLAPLLPAVPSFAITDIEAEVLRVYRGIKGGQREEYLTGRYAGGYGSITNRALTKQEMTDAIAALVSCGFLKANKAGAVSVTTQGKNLKLNRKG